MYREVTMIEFREVLRLWQEQVPKKRIAALLGLDPKTLRRYLRAAEAAGLRAQRETLSDEQVRDVLLELQPSGGRPHGEDWTRCSEQGEAIAALAGGGIAAYQDSQTPGAAGRVDRLPHALPFCRRAAAVRTSGYDHPDPRRLARPGSASGYGLGAQHPSDW
jgi:predicted nucleic acid-binding Zn ribbon protein